MSLCRIQHIENHIYEWRTALQERALGVTYFRIYLVNESHGDLGKIGVWMERNAKDVWFERVYREMLDRYLCDKDVLDVRLELDGEGAYCLSTSNLSDPYGFIMEKAHENNLDVMSILVVDSYVRVMCVSNKTVPWEILEDGLARRGLFLVDFGFDQYGRVVVTCGTAKK